MPTAHGRQGRRAVVQTSEMAARHLTAGLGQDDGLLSDLHNFDHNFKRLLSDTQYKKAIRTIRRNKIQSSNTWFYYKATSPVATLGRLAGIVLHAGSSKVDNLLYSKG
jgi:hypothetical protein